MYNMAQVRTNMLSILEEHVYEYLKVAKSKKANLNEMVLFGKVVGSIEMIQTVLRVIHFDDEFGISRLFEDNLPKYKIAFYNKSNPNEIAFFIEVENKYYKES